MKRTKAGSAWIEEHPKGSGKWRVRARIDGKAKTVAGPLTEAKAAEARDAYLVVSSAADLRHGVTVKQFGIGFNERRKRKGVRGHYKDAKNWDRHIAADPIGDIPVSSLERRDLVEWLDRKTTVTKGERKAPMAHRTRIKILNLFRVALGEAVERGLLEHNPAANLKVHRAGAASVKDDLEGILTPDEQRALIAAVPARWQPCVVFALLTGLRQAEQWWLQWDDVGPDAVIVRRSRGGLPTKSGRVRAVELLEPAKAALEAVRFLRRGARDQIVFQAERGGRLPDGKPPREWKVWLRDAGITRPIRWHDLRHTCATSLLAGWWGRKWTLDEVCKLLGHSSITVTERYARKLNETLKLAVAQTPGLTGLVIPTPAEMGAKTPAKLLLPEGSGGASQVTETTEDSTAFVKRRSQVQVQQSAPSAEPAEKLLVSATGGDTEKGDDGEQNGINSDLKNPRQTRDLGDQRATQSSDGWWGPSDPPVAAGDFEHLRGAGVVS